MADRERTVDRADSAEQYRDGGTGPSGQAAGNRPVQGAPAQSYLQPIAPPSILGLFGFAGATFIVTAYLAGWYGGPATETYLAPFAAAFGGLAQFMAGMWSYRARDGVATAMHGMWGSFWIGYGILFTLIAVGALSVEQISTPLGFWFIALAGITLMGAIAATTENLALAIVLHSLWVGAALLAVAFLTGSAVWQGIAAYTLMFSAISAWYTASALMFKSVGNPILPVGESQKLKDREKFDAGIGEPGIQHGQ